MCACVHMLEFWLAAFEIRVDAQRHTAIFPVVVLTPPVSTITAAFVRTIEYETIFIH